MNGLILQGGGARGAYQAGFLLGLSEIVPSVAVPFNSFSGVSVGAINASILAMDCHNFRKASLKLKNYWLHMGCDDVYELGRWGILSSWKNILNNANGGALFDNAPLRGFLSPKIDFSGINERARRQSEPIFLNIHAYSYKQSKNVLFTNSNLVRRCNERTVDLSVEHVLASTAIPYIFPSNFIDNEEFGDGGLQLLKPSLPLIQQGCTKIMGITLDHCPSRRTDKSEHVFSAVFPDAISADFEKIERKNMIKKSWWSKSQPRTIETMLIRPSLESYHIQNGFIHALPRSLNIIAKAMGLHNSQKSNVLNYIVFDKDYANYLIDTGYKDALSLEREITSFFS